MSNKTYKCLTPIEHVLARPNMYIGNIKNEEMVLYIYDNNSKSLVEKEMEFNSGFERLYEEILLNAYDHFNDTLKSTNPVTKINVIVNQDEGFIEIMNNGEGIPIYEHEKEKILIPEMVFSKLNSSSNYDDTKDRFVAGVNGLGAKLTVIYSTKFIVETVDCIRGKKFKMIIEDNLLKGVTNKRVTDYKGKSYTKVRYYPDFKRFGLNGITDDMFYYFKKRCYDLIACGSSDNKKCKVKLSFNGDNIEIKTFKDYVKLYYDDNVTDKNIFYEKINDKWQFGLVLNSDDTFKQVSFSNGIYTSEGGTHVKRIMDQIVKAIKNKLKNSKISDSNIRNKFDLFLCCEVNQPAFTSQSKTLLKTPIKEFSSLSKISKSFINKILKSDVITDLKSLGQHKESKEMKKNDGKKVVRIKGKNPHFDDASKAGSKHSLDCRIFITEGLSAKNFVTGGFKVLDSSKYGIYPLTGKVMNTLAKSDAAVAKNKVLSELQQYIGLQHKTVYYDDVTGKPTKLKKGYTTKHIKTLRYGGIISLTDEDLDGYHIKGLIINWIFTYWPELLALGFIYSFKTPIVRARKKKEILDFYTLKQFNDWTKDNNLTHWSIKYYKGLGTWEAADKPKLFKNFDKYLIRYYFDIKSNDNINLAFNDNKKYIEKRKDWLRMIDDENFIDYNELTKQRNEFIKVDISDFINLELKRFSYYDNHRSLPSIVDGLKPTQRKIIFGLLDKKLKVNYDNGIKVSQLTGHVSKVSSYHHGEMSIYTTIANMANNYCGTNNINLLAPKGSFGTRHNPKCSADRYIFTRLEDITKLIFREEDMPILNYLDDEGLSIEPEYYVPIIPMILVNGAIGIGTGYSTSIPLFNPLKIIKILKDKLDEKKDIDYDLLPFYKNYKGGIDEYIDEKDDNDITWIYKGIININEKEKKIHITELPPKLTVTDYKVSKVKGGFESRYNKKNKKDVDIQFNDSMNVETPDFELVFGESTKDTEEYFKYLMKIYKNDGEEALLKELSLMDSEKSTNMHLFDKNNVLTRYKNIEEIITEYYNVRYEYYIKRKVFVISELERKLKIISNKVRFIKYINSKKIIITNKKKKDIEDVLLKNKFDKIENTYNYLTDMKISVLTLENAEKMENTEDILKQELDEYRNLSVSDLWYDELEELELEIKKIPGYQ
jgi:DNA topoisomerase-2